MRDCNTFRGLVSNGNEIIERFRWTPSQLGAAFLFVIHLIKFIQFIIINAHTVWCAIV